MSSQSNVIHLRQSYQIKIVLSHIKPPIWRRLVIDSRVPLDVLHDIIQVSMGWADCHMHQFTDQDGVVYGQLYDDGFMSSLDGNTIDESVVLLNELLKNEKDWIKYEYDFGDGWEHKIILEKISPHKKNQLPIVCLKGRRACPPEDCGGPGGYQRIIELLAKPEDEQEYDELLEWLGGEYESEQFDTSDTNQLIKDVFEGIVFNGKASLDNELQRIESEYDMSVEKLGLKDFGLEGINREDWRLFEGIDSNNSDLANITNDLLNDPELPLEIKQLIGGMQETTGLINYMDDMLEQSIEAFEQIVKISNDKSVTRIAEKMLKALSQD